MRLPPGYGQIVKLSGKRRRPYAVRIDAGAVKKGDRYVRQQKYLEYFAKKSDALDYLAKYNAGIEVDRRPSASSLPTFADVYVDFMDWYDIKHPETSQSARQSYITAYKHAHALHAKKFITIRTADMQAIMAEYSDKSKSTAAGLLKLFHGMYKYAMMNEMVDRDYSQFVFSQGRKAEKPMHKPFTPDEIRALWDVEAYPVLIMIYTGLRIGEFLRIECDNVDIDAHVMIGGIKTAAGRNRVIPIHNAILPLVSGMLSDNQYLFHDMNYNKFLRHPWPEWMTRIGSSHMPHDTRHTCATLMEQAGVPLHHQKLILGHSIQDITQGIYTHVELSVLVDDINLLPDFRKTV